MPGDWHASRDVLVHDEDTPSNGPLLETHESSTFRRRRKLRDIDWDLGRFDTDCDAVDYTADDKHGDVLGGTSHNPEDEPLATVFDPPVDWSYQIQHPDIIDPLRPIRSDRIPEIKSPSQEPAAIEVVTPPGTSEPRPRRRRQYVDIPDEHHGESSGKQAYQPSITGSTGLGVGEGGLYMGDGCTSCAPKRLQDVIHVSEDSRTHRGQRDAVQFDAMSRP